MPEEGSGRRPALFADVHVEVRRLLQHGDLSSSSPGLGSMPNSSDRVSWVSRKTASASAWRPDLYRASMRCL